MREVAPTILETGWYDSELCSPHIELALAFDPGPEREAWLAHCRDYLGAQVAAGYDNTYLWYLSARVKALDGELEAAATDLQRAVAGGWRHPWTLHDPLLRPILGEPGVVEALASIKEDLARQRVELEVLAKRWGYME